MEPKVQMQTFTFALIIVRIIAQSFTKVGNNGKANVIQINGIGADEFNPNKMSNWHYEYRFPLIAAKNSGTCPKNIYAPSIVNNGATTWNIYFGGWDGVSSCHDSVSVTVTEDTFTTLNPHESQIATGNEMHVNNPNCIKINESHWNMVYTVLPLNSNLNKPGYSIATTGIDWTPNSGNANYMIAMNNYPYNWSNANVNGGNVIYYDYNNKLYHLYFIDFHQESMHSVFHATSNNLKSFIFQNIALNEPMRVVNDMKKINGNYLMGLHMNTQNVWYSVSNNMSQFPTSKVLYTNMNDEDKYITSMGWIVNDKGNILMGSLYGASKVSALDENSIYCVWLQKQVLFINNETMWGIGDASRGNGPNHVIMDTNAAQATGKFYLYDSDYVDVNNRGTLIYESPVITVQQGDIWQYKSQ
eukprot:201961_1